MIRILPWFAAVLAACTSSPEETAMRGPRQSPGTPSADGSKAASEAPGNAANPAGRGAAAKQEHAALGPVPAPVSAAENPAPAPSTDSAAEARGRRTLSTAFVRVGPDGHLTVELRDGRVLVLRQTVLHRKKYCGVQVIGGREGAPYCGGYDEVAAARPGGAPRPAEPDLAAPNRLELPDGAKRN